MLVGKKGSPMLKIGDKVRVKSLVVAGNSHVAVVKNIEVYGGAGSYAADYDGVHAELPWAKVRGRDVIVDLEGGSWAYASQLVKFVD
jgi:hypothetical protein